VVRTAEKTLLKKHFGERIYFARESGTRRKGEKDEKKGKVAKGKR